MPKVSIILPVYNAAIFLKDAIDSIINQTYNDFELIIINDGSTDNPEDIILSYDDERIVYIFQENLGVAKTLNTGIQLAKGELIWRHDADDISCKHKLEVQVDFLMKNIDFGLCGTQIAFMSFNGKIAFNYLQPSDSYFNGSNFRIVNRADFNPYSPITHATILVRKELLENLRGYRDWFVTSEDIDTWLRLLQITKLAVIKDPYYFVRLSNSSVTQIHGWKNRWYKEKALEYYDLRIQGIKDPLELNTPEIPPNLTPYTSDNIQTRGLGKKYNEELIYFLAPLYLDARDWRLTILTIFRFLKEGFLLFMTWKAFLIFLIGKKKTEFFIILKRFMKFKWLD
jgi:glycosyltransferase involved in cell wall biosynthesis